MPNQPGKFADPAKVCRRGIPTPGNHLTRRACDRTDQRPRLALNQTKWGEVDADEWRVHFHVPLHAPPGGGLGDTRNHVLQTLDWLQENPDSCHHLEMETYTWEVLPEELRSFDVVEQIIRNLLDTGGPWGTGTRAMRSYFSA